MTNSMTEGENNNLDNNNKTGQTQDNNYQQKGTLGIGHMSGGEIKDGANVGGVIYDIDAKTVVIQQPSNSEQTPPQTLSQRENNERDSHQNSSNSEQLDSQNTPSNIKKTGSANFVGREEKLEELHQLLQKNEKVTVSAIAGRGGIGKSEFANA